jgi:dTDP-4-amino-4,6-dideoxygalactose transaminase
MKISFVDLKRQYQLIKPEIDLAVSNVIQETAFIGGKYVEKFENEFAALYGVKHCISVANGTDSLYILLKMMGIGLGDEVITVANSWISSSETIGQTGAKPVFVDINPDYYTIDENILESAINSRTKGIIPVHLFGQMCRMDKIMEIANKHGIPVIEDCAQSHFSEFSGKRAGTMGIAGSFSFYPGKNLGAYGDAGCIITNDSSLAEKCKMFARHGALKKHQHQIEGINSRLDGLQAAILSAKLPHILDWTEARIAKAAAYDALLSGIEGITIPKVRSGSKHSYHLYVIRAERRNELMEFLKEKGIETAIHYPTPLPFLKAYEGFGFSANDFPISHSYSTQILSLPIFPELQMDEISFVANSIKEFYS